MLSSIEYLTQIELKCSYDNVAALRNSLLDVDSQVISFFRANFFKEKNGYKTVPEFSEKFSKSKLFY